MLRRDVSPPSSGFIKMEVIRSSDTCFCEHVQRTSGLYTEEQFLDQMNKHKRFKKTPHYAVKRPIKTKRENSKISLLSKYISEYNCARHLSSPQQFMVYVPISSSKRTDIKILPQNAVRVVSYQSWVSERIKHAQIAYIIQSSITDVITGARDRCRPQMYMQMITPRCVMIQIPLFIPFSSNKRISLLPPTVVWVIHMWPYPSPSPGSVADSF
jgi:hypothetical protein